MKAQKKRKMQRFSKTCEERGCNRDLSYDIYLSALSLSPAFLMAEGCAAGNLLGRGLPSVNATFTDGKLASATIRAVTSCKLHASDFMVRKIMRTVLHRYLYWNRCTCPKAREFATFLFANWCDGPSLLSFGFLEKRDRQRKIPVRESVCASILFAKVFAQVFVFDRHGAVDKLAKFLSPNNPEIIAA